MAPRFSIFTPTHNPKFLSRLEDSLRGQTFQDFEWVVVPNGQLSPNDLRLTLPQVRIIPAPPGNTKIGFLKKFACNHSRGEILVEVDHDDELFPDALEILDKEFEEETDFAYSNFCDVQRDGTPRTFEAKFGWRSREIEYRGQRLLESIAFEPSPASFSKIWFAPNHVRAWRRKFYYSIGGHNEEMAILDDHEILCQTYLKGSVKHIDRPLYIYHIHDDNTCYGEANTNIQTQTLDIHDRYIYPMVERWCDLNGLRKIDLCGGFSCPPGYEAVDVANAPIIADLDGEWPFESGEVGLFRAHDAMEHLKNPINTMKQAYRALAPNGWMLTLTPSSEGRGAYQDPTHVSFWNSNSFWYYTRQDQAKYIGTPVKFQLNRIKNFYPSAWHETHKILYVKADLLKFAGRTPGLVEFDLS